MRAAGAGTTAGCEVHIVVGLAVPYLVRKYSSDSLASSEWSLLGFYSGVLLTLTVQITTIRCPHRFIQKCVFLFSPLGASSLFCFGISI